MKIIIKKEDLPKRRIPIPKPGSAHRNEKSDYRRKPKHPKDPA